MQINLLKAQTMAKCAHEGQFRKWTGEPYIQHPARVVSLLQGLGYESPPMLAIAWLHDTLKRGALTADAIREAFGDYVAVMVEDMTKPFEPCTETGVTIKLCDIYDNVRNIAEVAPPVDALAYLAIKSAQVDRLVRQENVVSQLVRQKIEGAMILADGKRLLETPAYF